MSAMVSSPASPKLCLIMPGRSRRQVEVATSRPWMPPSSLLVVAAMTPENYRIVLWDENAQGYLLPDTLPAADIYALSGLSTSRRRAYELADMIHASTDKPVTAGGMDVTGHYLEGHGAEQLDRFDTIVVGRLTRKLWQKVLDDLLCNIKGLSYQAGADEPWEYVIPRHDLIEPGKYFLPAALRTSEGCAQRCPFCTVHLITGGLIRCKPKETLEQELLLLPQSKRPIVVSDDSFGADCQHTLGVGLPVLGATGRPWFTEITLRDLLGGNGRPELLGPISTSGCAGVYVGIESVIGPHNEFLGRVCGKSLGLAETEGAVKRIHDKGMLVLGSFVLDAVGSETPDDIKRTVAWIIRHKLDFVQLSLTALLPGSAMRANALKNGRVIDNNPDHLCGAWPTIEHPMSAQERIELLQWAYKEIFSTRNIARRLLRTGGRWHALVALANWQIHKSAANWARQFGYDHWLATRELVQDTPSYTSAV